MKKLCMVVYLLCICGFVHAAKKPNILFFYADDWGRIASCYADDDRFGGLSSVVKTPAIDRVAEEGIVFSRAYYPVSQCTPCRASIATGSYFWRAGKRAFLNWKDGFEGEDPGAKLPGFGAALVEQGYLMKKSCKTMNQSWTKTTLIPGVLAKGRYSLAIYEGESGADRRNIRAELEAGYRTAMKNVLAARKEGQPFYFVYGPINTHRPWIQGSGKELWGLEPETLKGKLPAFLPDVPEVREDMADYLGEIQALDLMLNCFMEELAAAGELDSTVIIVTGDNGPPGFTRGKTNCFDFGAAAPLMIRWPGVVHHGRKVTDFVNLMDLGPTFIDIGGGKIPAGMNGKSLVPILAAKGNGRIEPERDHVVFGRERHVHDAREGNLSYPSRAIRTDDFLYIINPHADRWPEGDPYESAKISDPSELARIGGVYGDTAVAFFDIDGSPTKAWVMACRDDPANRKYWEWAFAKRPAEEFYDVRSDPFQLKNLANDERFSAEKAKLAARLRKLREDTEDPRLTDLFDQAPWASPGNQGKRALNSSAVPSR
ncbi:MAG: sulfatase [Kiritimatiellales bacterium]|nr:sulfatase [Kiritimatiellales bacterium]